MELSFANFPASMLLLFCSATGDDWPSYMWLVMEKPSRAGELSMRDDSSPAALYFVAWVYFGQWLLVNLVSFALPYACKMCHRPTSASP